MRSGRSRRPLRVVTYLAPSLFWFYRFVTHYLAKKIRYPAEIEIGSDYGQLSERADLAFVCSLPYVQHSRGGSERLEPLVAPVLCGARYAGKPIHFSDVIVKRDNPARSFTDLRGRSWAYNERHSQSGYGIVRDYLLRIGETRGFFSKVVETGYHQRSMQMVSSGAVDAAAIDCHVLATVTRDDPALAANLRIIQSLGPSPIQPIVAGSRLSRAARHEVKSALVEMSKDCAAKHRLTRALIERFAPVSDSTYDEIRTMIAVAEAEQFVTIR